MEPEPLLISACLLGVCCRYDGKGNGLAQADELKKRYHLIPVCPEVYGGLSTPRVPSEILNGRVINRAGEDMTSYFQKGAEETLKIAQCFNCSLAFLKERSPSCGAGRVYDGTFTGTLVPGNGVAADLLLQNGIKVFGESEIEKLL